jgi:hypothetical protein
MPRIDGGRPLMLAEAGWIVEMIRAALSRIDAEDA